MTDLAAALDELHDATSTGWSVGRPYHDERREWRRVVGPPARSRYPLLRIVPFEGGELFERYVVLDASGQVVEKSDEFGAYEGRVGDDPELEDRDHCAPHRLRSVLRGMAAAIFRPVAAPTISQLAQRSSRRGRASDPSLTATGYS